MTKKIITSDAAMLADAADAGLSRRQMILMGGAGLVTLVGLGGAGSRMAFAQSAIISTPALEEGPYWIDETGATFHRSDVRTDVSGANLQTGLPLRLGLTVGQLVNGVLVPLPNAFVYMWHCNAAGLYSGEATLNTASNTYLRGYQVTNAHGTLQFVSIYPGWYSGRTVHIHLRVRLYPGNDPTKTPTYDYETQLFFDDAITTQVYKNVAPYSARAASRDTLNTTDHVYTGASLDADGVTANAGALTRTNLAAKPNYALASFGLALNLSLAETTGGGGGTGGGPGGGGPGGGGPGGGGP